MNITILKHFKKAQIAKQALKNEPMGWLHIREVEECREDDL